MNTDDRFKIHQLGRVKIRKFKTIKDKTMWSNIYDVLSEYGGFHNQGEATDRIFSIVKHR